MITAVDTSVLLDILSASKQHIQASKDAYTSCLELGKMMVCPVVWSELRPWFESDSEMKRVAAKLQFEFDPFDEISASLAGEIWQKYRKSGGKRERLVPDFLVGAHALTRADRLLTRDRGFYRSFFTKLPVLDPSEAGKRPKY